MPEKDTKKPPPPQPLRTFLNLSAAPDPAFAYDPTKPRMQPYVPTRGQLRAQAGLMGLADLVRGLTIGASDEKDSNAAQIGELIQTGIPFLKSLGLGVATIRGGLKIVNEADDVADVARGLYSRVDEALKLIPTKGAHPNKVASLLKSNASAEELAFRKVPEFLAAKGNATVTPAELAAHLAAHPAPMPVVKTLGEPRPAPTPTPVDTTHWAVTQGPNERWKVTDTATGEIQGYVFHGDPGSGGARTAAEAQDIVRNRVTSQEREAAAKVGRPKYASYQVPGGENYRETLSTLPQQPNNPYEAFIAKMDQKYGEGYDTDVLTPDERTMQSMLWERSQRGPGAMTEGTFRSGHFDEPNILVHTRANERTLPTGEPGRFIEEVQSDWHQAGKKHGYRTDADERFRAIVDEVQEKHGASLIDLRTYTDNPEIAADIQRVDDAYALAAAELHGNAVPDAPFKESWPDLGLKQQVLEAANDPNAQWIGHTSGQTQAARYDLSKQIGRLEYADGGDKGKWLRAYDHDGNRLMDQMVPPDKLADHIGKEAAERLLAAPTRSAGLAAPVQELEGLDLQVGGEGMRHFYDNLLPKRLEKILKPFGGKVEPFRLTHEAHPSSGVDTETSPAWIARLTPEMKARIRREGLPLLSLLGMGALWQAPTERPENRQ